MEDDDPLVGSEADSDDLARRGPDRVTPGPLRPDGETSRPLFHVKYINSCLASPGPNGPLLLWKAPLASTAGVSADRSQGKPVRGLPGLPEDNKAPNQAFQAGDR